MCIFAGGERFAKGLNTPIRLDVCDIVFMLSSYSCIHAIIEQEIWEFSQIGNGFNIGTETPAHPLMKHEFKTFFIGEKSAKGSRKVGERRFNLCFRCRAICKTT